MKALYITSLQTFSGKTALCAALGRRLQAEGRRVGYFKPLSTQAWEPVPGRAADEDADFIRRTLGLDDPPDALVGVVLTPSLLRDTLCQCAGRDLLGDVRRAYERVAAGKDVLVVEGGASLREGVGIGLGPAEVADALDVPVLAVVRFDNEMNLVDDCVVAKIRLGGRLLGVVVNAVPEEALSFVRTVCCPCLEDRGIPVLGVLPRREELQAISVGELAQVLSAEFLAAPQKRDVLIQNMVVGAMSVEQALPRLRRIPGAKAVITGGDRTDMQLAALETASQCLILTGQMHPQPEVLRRAEELGVPVLLVRHHTLAAVEAIERVFGKTRLGQKEKLERFEALVAKHVDFARLYRGMGLGA